MGNKRRKKEGKSAKNCKNRGKIITFLPFNTPSTAGTNRVFPGSRTDSLPLRFSGVDKFIDVGQEPLSALGMEDFKMVAQVIKDTVAV